MKKILIVDDSDGIRILLSMLIRRWGEFQIFEAPSLAEAVDLCIRNKFELIFLDHHLGDGIGWDLAKELCRNPGKYGSPEIIAMSGSVLPEKAMEEGFLVWQFLPKPFDIARIEKILKEFSSGKESSNPEHPGQ